MVEIPLSVKGGAGAGGKVQGEGAAHKSGSAASWVSQRAFLLFRYRYPYNRVTVHRACLGLLEIDGKSLHQSRVVFQFPLALK